MTAPYANPGPCKDCGKPKTPGKGSRLCEPCRRVRLVVRWEMQSERITRPYSPCMDCGGPKVPEGVKARQGQKVCASCLLIRREKDRVRRADRHKRTYVKKTRVYKPKATPAPKVRVSLSSSPTVPREIAEAWGRAGHGSQFRKLCPTRKELVERFGVAA